MRIRFPFRAVKKVFAWAIICGILATLGRHSLSDNSASHQTLRKVAKKPLFAGNLDHTVVIPRKFLENIPNVSLHQFKYILEPGEGNLCFNGNRRDDKKDHRRAKLLILFVVHSKADHFRHRETIRETWGSIGNRLTQLVFLLGNPKNTTLQDLIRKENAVYGDIVQENFTEVYRNITLKSIMGLKWASQQCQNAKYVVKADDDMFVNARMLLGTLVNSRLPKKNLILCKIHFFKNVPREGKYAIGQSLYSANYWPSFCFGGCWILSMDVVRKLYEISLQTRQIYLDDVYVTGILRTKLSLPINYLSKAYRVFCHAKGDYTVVRNLWNEFEDNWRKRSTNIQGIDSPVKSWTLCFM